jgi:hypothetical protein
LWATGSYLGDVGAVFKGYGKAIVGLFTSPWTMYEHFRAHGLSWDSAKSLVVGGVQAIGQGLSGDDPEAFGESVFTLLMMASPAIKKVPSPKWLPPAACIFSKTKQGGGATKCFGDLTQLEIQQIQQLTNQAGRPIHVVGSAARGERRGIGTNQPIGKGPGTRSDIDYVIPISSMDYWKPYIHQLPGIDWHGPLPGSPNPFMGPSIPFEPRL